MTRKWREGGGSQAVLEVSDRSDNCRGNLVYEDQEEVFCCRIK